MSALPGLVESVGMAPACAALGLSRASVYRERTPKVAATAPATRTPPLKLSDAEQSIVIDELMSERFVDRAPHQVYATLLDEGRYLCSIRTMYRVLAAQQAVRERRNQRVHPVYARPELMAEAPGQLWSWDITKLKTSVKWTYLYLYVVLDVFSRYVVGWLLSTKESAALARELVEQSALREAIPSEQLILHADRGAPMRSKTLSEKLVDLGIEPSFSRPRQSNDNPFSESFFKTTKFAPEFPDCFESMGHARDVLTPFFEHYNHHHRHTGIGLMTPAAVHRGDAPRITAARSITLSAAFERHPQRFKGTAPKPPRVPDKVYINPPLTEENELVETAAPVVH
jgi:putative transposase